MEPHKQSIHTSAIETRALLNNIKSVTLGSMEAQWQDIPHDERPIYHFFKMSIPLEKPPAQYPGTLSTCNAAERLFADSEFKINKVYLPDQDRTDLNIQILVEPTYSALEQAGKIPDDIAEKHRVITELLQDKGVGVLPEWLKEKLTSFLQDRHQDKVKLLRESYRDEVQPSVEEYMSKNSSYVLHKLDAEIMSQGVKPFLDDFTKKLQNDIASAKASGAERK